MKIHVQVVPLSKVQSIEELWLDMFWLRMFKVKLKAKPVDWDANKELIDSLSVHFDTIKKNIKILTWHTSKNKLIEIENFKS